jgi:hypothetical protein
LFLHAPFFGCKPTLHLPVSSDPVKQQLLLKGRGPYVTSCSGCHNLHFPKEYGSNGWEVQPDKMQDRAKINDKEKQLIYDYLSSQL